MKIRLEDRSVQCTEVIHPNNNTIAGIEIIPGQYKLAVFSYHTDLAFSNFRVDMWVSYAREQSATLKFDGRMIYSMACKSDGTEILTGSAKGEIARWDAKHGQLAQYHCGDDSILSVAWSPDGTKFAGVGSDNHVYVVEAATHEVKIVADIGTPPALGEGDALAWVGWSPDGKYLATVGWDAKVRVWETWSNGFKPKYVLAGHRESLYCGVWSPDGSKLASAGNKICIWDAASGTLLQTFGKRDTRINTLAWNPDNRYLAIGDSKGTVTVWDTATGKEMGQIQTTLDDIRAVAWFDNYLLYGGKNSHRWMVPFQAKQKIGKL